MGFAFFASLGLPGLSGFVSEFLVFSGSFPTYPLYTIISATGVIITAAYHLWAIQRMFLGKLNPAYKGYPDLNWRERLSLYPLGAIAIVLGFYPQFILGAVNTGLHELIKNRPARCRRRERPRWNPSSSSSGTTWTPRSGSGRSWRSRSGRCVLFVLDLFWKKSARARRLPHRGRARGARRRRVPPRAAAARRDAPVQRDARERRVRELLQVALPRRRRAHRRSSRRRGRTSPRHRIGEFFALLVAVVLGMFLMASATDLLMVYLSIELVSMVSYVLAGFRKGDRKAAEGSLKYVIYGGVASGVMLFGMSYLYGLTGTTSLLDIGARIGALGGAGASLAATRIALVVAVVFVATGVGYKIAAVPWHMWCPDVYEGAPTPFTAFLSVGPKAAGFALALRLLRVRALRPGVAGDRLRRRRSRGSPGPPWSGCSRP